MFSPSYKSAATDGIAVMADDTYEARNDNPLILTEKKQFVYVDTGAPVEGKWDAIIEIKDIQILNKSGSKVEIRRACSPWHNLRSMGEDIVKGEMIIPAGRIITAEDMGAMLSGGVTHIDVTAPIRVGIIPTGSEVVSPWAVEDDGVIIDSNSFMFEALIKDLGAISTRYDPVEDDIVNLRTAILIAAEENDVIIVNAGSSSGRDDFTSQVVEGLGQLSTHGVGIKPGKPTVLGTIKGKPIVGTPGYPVAAFIVFNKFVTPVVKLLSGYQPSPSMTIDAKMSRNLVSDLNLEEYVPVKLGRVNGINIATPVRRGSGISMSLVQADGMVTIPQNTTGIPEGTMVEVSLLNPITHVNHTVVATGSYDPLLDSITNQMMKETLYTVSSTNLGNQSGLMALKRKECHIAPIHLLNPNNGKYNVDVARDFFPDENMVLIKGVGRIKGLMFPKDNPKNIKSIKDLTRSDVSFMNRQRGSGTRSMLDYILKQANISPKDINGYYREAYTHIAVAAEIESGNADVGLGTVYAANSLDLDFLPIAQEDYDFLCHEDTVDLPSIQVFIQALQSQSVLEFLEMQGGYSMDRVGEIIPVTKDN